MPDAAIIGESTVSISPITTNLFPSKLTVRGKEVVLDGAIGAKHGLLIHSAGGWFVKAISKLTVGGRMVAVAGNIASCFDVDNKHIVIATSKLSINSTITVFTV